MQRVGMVGALFKYLTKSTCIFFSFAFILYWLRATDVILWFDIMNRMRFDFSSPFLLLMRFPPLYLCENRLFFNVFWWNFGFCYCRLPFIIFLDSQIGIQRVLLYLGSYIFIWLKCWSNVNMLQHMYNRNVKDLSR